MTNLGEYSKEDFGSNKTGLLMIMMMYSAPISTIISKCSTIDQSLINYIEIQTGDPQ
jgi:hypothetical protein